MFIAHLFSGYILTDKLQRSFAIPLYMTVGLLASILPDLDMLYFYLIDNQQHLHHGYWTHIPFFWFCIAVPVFISSWLWGKRIHTLLALVFFVGILVHLFLDTIVGKIEWLQPFSSRAYYLFEVPAVYNFWVWNFVLHWTFLFELILI